MRRLPVAERRNWRALAEANHFVYHSTGGGYWKESAHYEFTAHEIAELERATNELHQMCLQAVEHVLRSDLLYRYQIPPDMYDCIAKSWRERRFSLYGRFDLAYDGVHPPKLLEYNADTPTGLLEGAVFQRIWQREVMPDVAQFNAIEEALVKRWREHPSNCGVLHGACLKGSPEDLENTRFILRCAAKAGFQTEFLYIDEIGDSPEQRQFIDITGRPISLLYKLYPWEWIWGDAFSQQVLNFSTEFIEPAWKMLLSNKALLPILWELFPGHPNLLPASFYAHTLSGDVVRKPLLSREGANIQIWRHGDPTFETSGAYGEEGYIYQELYPLPEFDNRHPVIGSWVVGDTSVGIGIREDASLVTKNTSWFVPHIIR